MIVVQSLSCIQLFVTPWTAAHWAFLSFINFQSLLKLTSIESVMSSNHLILCRPLLLLPLILPSIRVFSNESALRIRWPKYWSFRFSISPFSEYSGLISFRIDIKFFYGINFLLTPDSISWSLGEKIHFNRGFTGGRRMVTFRTNTNPGSYLSTVV